MRNSKLWLICLLMVLVIPLVLFAADIPKGINYQGKVLDNGGPLTDPDRDFQFILYQENSPGGGGEVGVRDGSDVIVWGPATFTGAAPNPTVNVKDGLFSLILADEDGGGDNISNCLEYGNLYLEVTIWDEVGSTWELLGAEKLWSVPYALNVAAGSGNYVQFHPDAAQTSGDVTTPLIHLNENGTGTANLLELEENAVDQFVVTNDGDVTMGQNLTLSGSATGQILAPTDQALDIFADQGIEVKIDSDGDAATATFKVTHDAAGNDLFIVREANYVQIIPRVTEPGGASGGIYVNGNATGTDSIYFYNGSAWQLFPTGDFTGAYIQNQYSSEQSASWLIAGKGKAHNITDSDTALIGYATGANAYGVWGRVTGANSEAIYGEYDAGGSDNFGYLGSSVYGVC